MALNDLSLNPLRAFEAASRHLSFTRAAEELCVTQAAVSHQVRALEDYLGASLFRRTTKGLVLTDEGVALAPIIGDAFARIERALGTISEGGPREVLTVGVVGTFALGFLLERLADFRTQNPFVDLRIVTNNNKVDLWTESLDFAIRFGTGAWHGVQADRLLNAPISPLCSPAIAAQLRQVNDLGRFALLRSYRAQDWPAWLKAAGISNIPARGPIFDASIIMIQAAILGEGVAIAPPSMFQRELNSGALAQPFALTIDAGAYWLTHLISQPLTPAMNAFRVWLLARCAEEGSSVATA